MRIKWMELEAAKIADPYIKTLFPSMEAEKAEDLAASMEKYALLPETAQCALGYMSCLLEAGMGGSYSAYDRYCMDFMRSRFGKIPSMRVPIRFIGWGGEHNEIGPAYEIDSACHIAADSRIFYTDDDIQERPDYAEELARRIELASSGIADVRAEKLEVLRTMDSDRKAAHWCVTFRLDQASAREIAINGQPKQAEKNGISFFLLPKAGEFWCMLGEIVHSDPENAFVLAKHSFCMK